MFDMMISVIDLVGAMVNHFAEQAKAFSSDGINGLAILVIVVALAIAVATLLASS